jgi:hypothetical protein
MAYTIIRPGGLSNDAATGSGKLTADTSVCGSIARADVADLVVKALFSPKTDNKVGATTTHCCALWVEFVFVVTHSLAAGSTAAHCWAGQLTPTVKIRCNRRTSWVQAVDMHDLLHLSWWCSCVTDDSHGTAGMSIQGTAGAAAAARACHLGAGHAIMLANMCR